MYCVYLVEFGLYLNPLKAFHILIFSLTEHIVGKLRVADNVYVYIWSLFMDIRKVVQPDSHCPSLSSLQDATQVMI